MEKNSTIANVLCLQSVGLNLLKPPSLGNYSYFTGEEIEAQSSYVFRVQVLGLVFETKQSSSRVHAFIPML